MWFRVRERAIVAGSMSESVPRNEFLCSTREFGDFELRLKFRVLGEGANAGVQFRSRRVPDSNEVSGYQADLGEGWWGTLYDEARRNKPLVRPDAAAVEKAVKKGEWNDYRILCEGPRIRTWINGTAMIDYTEEDAAIPRRGVIGLQVHSGPPMEAWYKDIVIREVLPAKDSIRP